jgi:hypothetical protein
MTCAHVKLYASAIVAQSSPVFTVDVVHLSPAEMQIFCPAFGKSAQNAGTLFALSSAPVLTLCDFETDWHVSPVLRV